MGVYKRTLRLSVATLGSLAYFVPFAYEWARGLILTGSPLILARSDLLLAEPANSCSADCLPIIINKKDVRSRGILK